MALVKGSADHKQHLNLSTHAYHVICQDMFAFMHTDSLSGFLNAVFLRYFEYADASISIALKRKEEAIRKTLAKGNHFSEEVLRNVLKPLLEEEEQRLEETAHAYASGHMLKFRLNNENFAYLYPEEQDDPGAFHFPEDRYYKKVGQYVKAVLEEYASKSLFDRESIFFRETIQLLEHCAKSGTLVRLEFQNGSFDMKPYGIFADSEQEYHYLAGVSRPAASISSAGSISSARINSTAGASAGASTGTFAGTLSGTSTGTVGEHITSVRLPQILSAKTKTYRSGRLTNEQKKQIQHMMRTTGIPFLSQEEAEDIVVYMTKDGVRKYRKMLHLRPLLVKKEDYENYSIYHFHCTCLQARFYLFRLGGDTYVLKPESLREELRERYNAAAAMYGKEPEEFSGLIPR